jgi:hypothetical protein
MGFEHILVFLSKRCCTFKLILFTAVLLYTNIFSPVLLGDTVFRVYAFNLLEFNIEFLSDRKMYSENCRSLFICQIDFHNWSRTWTSKTSNTIIDQLYTRTKTITTTTTPTTTTTTTNTTSTIDHLFINMSFS